MEWRAVLAFILLIILTLIVLHTAYTVIPAVRDLSEQQHTNIRYTATGVLVREPSNTTDASGNTWKFLY
jgi:hypothetical protein